MKLAVALVVDVSDETAISRIFVTRNCAFIGVPDSTEVTEILKLSRG